MSSDVLPYRGQYGELFYGTFGDLLGDDSVAMVQAGWANSTPSNLPGFFDSPTKRRLCTASGTIQERLAPTTGITKPGRHQLAEADSRGPTEGQAIVSKLFAAGSQTA